MIGTSRTVVFLLLPTAAGLQSAAASLFCPGCPENTGDSVQAAWVSLDESLCAQGPARVAEGALALFKAMPRGAPYGGSFVVQSATGSCQERGFALSAGEDPCYPGLLRFHRDEAGENRSAELVRGALARFGEHYNLSLAEAEAMDTCACHDQSPAKRGLDCSAVESLEGSWVHRHPTTGEGLMCDGGPFLLAARALAVLKSTMQLPMHPSDQIAPVGCDQLGFPYQYPPEDHCFTGLHMCTRTAPVLTDPGIQESGQVEDDLRAGGFAEFARERGLSMNILDGIGGCHCAASSEVGRALGEVCELPGATSPIRDWWQD